ncbi:endospore germination permease [Paenibacillus terreus]|uniref:Endospore germination permease n=1 Tax=Paenibacillus terreus TaxID=1387834 RepID=A0ABV5B8L9_9BACL
MKQVRMGAAAMSSLMVLFQLGSALVVSPAARAGRDAWISTLIGVAAGMLLFLCYSNLHKRFPDMTLPAYSETLLGRLGGKAIGMAYVVFFMYAATRDLRVGAFLIDNIALRYTPTLIVQLLMILAVIYVLYLGIEVVGHTAVIYWAISILLIFANIVLIFASGIVDWRNLLPVAEDGWRVIAETGFTTALMFPFGEMVSFTMLLPLLERKYSATGVGITSLFVGGGLLVLSSLLTVSSLGREVFQRAAFPLLNTIGKVELSELINRVDVLVVMSIIIGVFFRIAVLFYAAIKSAEEVLHIPHGKLMVPFSLILLLSAALVAPNWEEHLREGSFMVKTVFPVFAVLLPVLLLIIAAIRQKTGRKAG